MLTPQPSGSRIDDFLPKYDFQEFHQTRIDAPPARVYECLLHSDFSQLCLTRALMTLRTGRRMPQPDKTSVPGDLRQRVQGTGFVILNEIPDNELVIGVAGRFWRPDGGRCMDLKAPDFIDFSRTGHAKAAWNFKLHEASPETETETEIRTTILSTETRIQCYGRAALWKFRTYWTLVGPFSGLIRKAILKHVKTQAESESR
ncbi:MAG: hypothetical protein ACLPN2_13700 [Terriglobales bacterium]